ncbi:MAG TPA: hypothetical protein PK141_22970 [Polyangiaceae bacterium]|nr:hypothetical protein [Polyangiaceae bacterium]
MSSPRLSRARVALLAFASLCAVGLAAAWLSAWRRLPAKAESPPGLTAASARYVLRWDRSGTAPAPAGPPGAFMVTSNLGYEVRVDRGFVVDTSASLVDCLGPGGDVWRSAGERAASRLATALLGVAHAGHSQAVDPSSLARATLTDLTAADGDIVAGETRFPEARYCHVHLVIAGGAGPSPYTATFPNVDTTRATLYVRGSWRRAGGEPHPFELHSTSVDALLVALPAVVEGSLSGRAAVVVLERRLATMFDDVALDALDALHTPAAPAAASAAAKAVLRNLDHRARVRVTTQ